MSHLSHTSRPRQEKYVRLADKAGLNSVTSGLPTDAGRGAQRTEPVSEHHRSRSQPARTWRPEVLPSTLPDEPPSHDASDIGTRRRLGSRG